MLDASMKKIAHILGSETRLDRPVDRISTDSRDVDGKTLYIPLKGERFDGHDFIAGALEKGAAGALSERPEDDPRIIRVESTLAALGILGRARRDEIDPLVVGLTGSVGKTTTKDMTALVLGTKYRTHKTAGNFNNEIGLPKTLLALEKEHEAAVIEMGMSHKGEIARLTRLAKPDIALITNIGSAHIEYLGSREGIRDAKLEIVEGLPAGGILILNGDEPLLLEKTASLRDRGFRILTFGFSEGCDYRAEEVTEEETSVSFKLRGVPFRVPLAGRHNIANALAASAAGDAAGVPLARAAEALAGFAPASAMRQSVKKVGGYTLLVDCYNAGPESMHASFQVAKTMRTAGKKIAVLGTMRELGEKAPAYHRTAGLEASGIFDRVITLGEGSPWYREGAPEAVEASGVEEIAPLLLELAAPGDLILFKGSRLNYLEKAAEAFENAVAPRG